MAETGLDVKRILENCCGEEGVGRAKGGGGRRSANPSFAEGISIKGLREMALARARPRLWCTLSQRTVTSLTGTPIGRLPLVTPLREIERQLRKIPAMEVRQKAFVTSAGLSEKENLDLCTATGLSPESEGTESAEGKKAAITRTLKTSRESQAAGMAGVYTDMNEITDALRRGLLLRNERDNREQLKKSVEPFEWREWRAEYFKVSPAVFQSKKERFSEILYNIFDEHVTAGRLGGRVSLSWNKRFNTTAGMTHFRMKKLSGDRFAAVVLSTKVLDTPEKLYKTLAHELCHAAQWIIDAKPKPPHGPPFKMWVYRFRCFDPTLDITTCHQYDIDYKYKYECISCKHIYGRHSKSIDVNRKVCGNCRGKLQLSVAQRGRPAISTPG